LALVSLAGIRGGGVIGLGIRFELALDPEVNTLVVVFPWVRAPQSGVRLAHCMEGVFHSTGLDGVVQGSESTVAIAFSEDLDNWDWIFPQLEVWVHIVVQAEFSPASPMIVHGIGLVDGNVRSDVFINNADISTKCIGFASGKSHQG
jgi:hypothetical protein